MEKYKFIENPYLPQGEAKVFISDADIKGVKVIKPYEIKELGNALSFHADLSVCIISAKKAVCPPESCAYYNSVLGRYGFDIIEGKVNLGRHYPSDSAYNVCIVGNRCFVNTVICDTVLMDALIKEGKEIIDVPQGYTKCSICPIDENTIITADSVIFREAQKRGMDCLLISNEGIELKGYSYGFFGGSCGMLSKNVLLVNGDLHLMKSGKEIKAFLSERKIEVRMLKKGRVCDVGSIIPVME